MWYAGVLTLHIVIACATIVVLVYAAYAIKKEKAAWYLRLGRAIAAFAIIETVTGVALAFLSPDISRLNIGVHLALYLGLCIIAEAVLAVKQKEHESRVWIG